MRCSCNVQHRQACECMPIPSFQSSSPGFCGRYPLAHAKQRSARLLVSLHYTIGLHGWTLRHILFSNFLNLHLVSFCSHSSTTQDPQDCARKENGISWASPECQGRRLNTTGGLIPGGNWLIWVGRQRSDLRSPRCTECVVFHSCATASSCDAIYAEPPSFWLISRATAGRGTSFFFPFSFL